MRAGVLSVLVFAAGCAYGQSSDCSSYVGDYAIQCQAYQQRKADTEVRQETANLLKAYRLCLQKYENDPTKAKENCSVYTQALHEIEIKGLPQK